MIHIHRMRAVHPHFITDQKGRKISVVLPIKDFDAIIATGSNNTSRYFDYYFNHDTHGFADRSSYTSCAQQI